MKYYLPLLCALFSWRVAVAGYGTNSFFITVDTDGVTPESVTAAKASAECRPAEQDPAGHWGEASEGYQLSVRFPKEVLHQGEDVLAAVLLRNCSTNYLSYSTEFGDDRDFAFLISSEKGQQLKDTTAPTSIIGHGTRSVPGTQRKFQVNLTKRYRLSGPGTYRVQVRRRVAKLDGSGWSEVTSAEVTIKVLPINGENSGSEK